MRIPSWEPKTCSTTAWPKLPSRAAHTTRKWTANAVSPQRPEQSPQGFSGLPALRIRPLFCFLTGSMVTGSDDIEQSSNNFGQCSKMIEDCSHCVRKSTGALQKNLRPSHLSNTATLVVLSRDVSHPPAIQQTPASRAVELQPAHVNEIGQGFGMGM
jgi:hypothetical protein